MPNGKVNLNLYIKRYKKELWKLSSYYFLYCMKQWSCCTANFVWGKKKKWYSRFLSILPVGESCSHENNILFSGGSPSKWLNHSDTFVFCPSKLVLFDFYVLNHKQHFCLIYGVTFNKRNKMQAQTFQKFKVFRGESPRYSRLRRREYSHPCSQMQLPKENLGFRSVLLLKSGLVHCQINCRLPTHFRTIQYLYRNALNEA